MITRYRLIIVAIIICLYSCNNLQDKTLETSLIPIDTVQVSESWKKEKWFNVRYQQLCDDQKGVFLDFKKIKKYGLHSPYQMVQEFFKDSAVISFEFISDCCISFSGEVLTRNDTLFLGYGSATDTINPCDCYCDYKMVYRIDTEGIHWKNIIIKNGRLK